MFSNDLKMIIVYDKDDEIIAYQLDNLLNSNIEQASSKNLIGKTEEKRKIKLVKWTEKVWNDNNNGTVNDPILFLDGVKTINNITPIIDYKFNEYGVKYGFVGKSAVLIVDTSEIAEEETYKKFLNALKDVSNAEMAGVVASNESIKSVKTWLKAIGITVMTGLAGLGAFLFYAYKDDKKMRKQMLLYGIIKLYLNDLQEFVESVSDC